jgi:hypothetical protein
MQSEIGKKFWPPDGHENTSYIDIQLTTLQRNKQYITKMEREEFCKKAGCGILSLIFSSLYKIFINREQVGNFSQRTPQ